MIFKKAELEKELKRLESVKKPTAEIIDDIVELEIESNALNQRCQAIHMFVNAFNDIDNQILIKKYIEGKNLTQISFELDLSLGYVQNRNASMVREIKRVEEMKLNGALDW